MDGGAWWAAAHEVAKSWTQLSDFTFTFHFPALEKEMATHSSVLAWRIPGTGEPGGLPSVEPHRVTHDWSDLAAAAAMLHLHRFSIEQTLTFTSYSVSRTPLPTQSIGNSLADLCHSRLWTIAVRTRYTPGRNISATVAECDFDLNMFCCCSSTDFVPIFKN